MARHNRSFRQNPDRRSIPSIEPLETRQVLSFFYPYPSSYSSSQQASRAAVVRHEYHEFVGEVKTLELKSQATPAEFLALRDDARAISAAASSANLPPASASFKALAVSLQIERAPLYGSLQDSGWDTVTSRVTANLASLDVGQPLIDRTLADMKTLAASAGVSSDDFQSFTRKFNTLRDGEAWLGSSSYYHFADPSLFYTQHLRGFFRGWGDQKLSAEAKLRADLRSAKAGTDSSGSAVLRHDVGLLQTLGAAVPSASNRQLQAAYVATFDQGVPTPQSLGSLRASMITILGAAGTSTRIAAVDQLIADAPALGRAVHSSLPEIQTLVTDVRAVVDAGGGESLDPFKVSIFPPARAK